MLNCDRFAHITGKISVIRFGVKPSDTNAISHGNRHTDSSRPQNRGMRNVGKRIKELRLERRMTQPQLAKELGVQQSSVSELETGISKSPSALTLLKIAKIFDVNPEYLLTGKGNMQKSGETLSDDELELVMRFRDLSSEGRQYILSRCLSLHENEVRDRPTQNPQPPVSQGRKNKGDGH